MISSTIRFFRSSFAYCLLMFACALSSLGTRATDSPRKTFPMDDEWRFYLGEVANAVAPEYDDHDWRVVDVPQDYVVEGTFSPVNPYVYMGMNTSWFSQHAFLPIYPAVYRKTFAIPPDAEGKHIWLEFDGVCSNSHYWLNGMAVGSQYSGYTRSRFDVTDAADPGKDNVLVVQVAPRYDGWWYEGGGIYRHVRMIIVDPVHIAPDGVFVMPEVTGSIEGARADAMVKVQTDIRNEEQSEASVTYLNEILDVDGKIQAAESSAGIVPARGIIKFEQQIQLPDADLWGSEHPTLYQLRSTLCISGKIVDQVTTNFGVRDVRFDADKGFFLNGKHLKLKGINMHQDHAGVGIGVPDRLFTWRLEKLQEVGCNAIRLSHNPVTPFLLDECDRMGFIVIAENRHFGDTYEDQSPRDTPAVEHRDLSALITRDRNHPSIVLWSLCNEQWIQGTPESAAIAVAMTKRVKELDPTRPVTAATNGGFDSPEGMASVLEVIGVNYHPDVYDPVHELFPDAPMVATEIASEISTRGIYETKHWEDDWGSYYGDPDSGYVSAYSITAGPSGQVVEDAWIPVVSRDFIAGGFVWAAFDYKGEPRPFEWPVINCHYGFMDICGFPKDNYYYYKAWWTDEPVLHLFPHWNWNGKEGEEISVWVHSNCDSVELFLNGVSQGVQTVERFHHLEWKIKYRPGKLEARGIYKGTPIETVRETTGKPAAIRLTADRSELTADNADLAVVKVEVIDSKCRVVPIADNKINFSFIGPAKLIGVGNGNPTCHEPDKANSRSAFNGLAQAIVQTTYRNGTIVFTAESPGLKSASIRLHSMKPQTENE